MQAALWRQHHRRCHHWSEHGTAAYFVKPDDAQKAELARGSLQLPSACRSFGHAFSVKQLSAFSSQFECVVAFDAADTNFEGPIPRRAAALLRDQVTRILLPRRYRVGAVPVGDRDSNLVARRFKAEESRLLCSQIQHGICHLFVAVVALCPGGSKDYGVVRRSGSVCNRHGRLLGEGIDQKAKPSAMSLRVLLNESR